MKQQSDRSFTAFTPTAPVALWLQVAAFALIFAMVTGFGAYDSLLLPKPNLFLVFQCMLILTVLLLAPRGTFGRLFFPLLFLCFLGWWFLSSLWSSHPLGFRASSARELATVVTMVLLASIVPVNLYIRCILYTGYVAIGLIFISIALKPHTAFSSTVLGSSGAGSAGGFSHKNFLAACLCVTISAVLAFEFRRGVRHFLAALIFGLILISQSSTGLAALLFVFGGSWVIDQYGWAKRTVGRSFLAVTILAGALFLGLFALTVGPAVALIGKDLTFTGRTLIWNGVIDAISKRPVIGYSWGGALVDYGSEPTSSITRSLGFPISHSHNVVLELLLRAGIVGLCLYLLNFVSMIRLGWRAVKHFEPIGKFIFLLAGVIVIFGFSESMTGFGVFFGFIVAFPAMRPVLRSNHESSSTPSVGTLDSVDRIESAPI